MKPTQIILLFGSFFILNVHSKPADPASDLDGAVAFIQCLQEAFTTGIPDADIPSYDPLIFTKNATIRYTLGSASVKIDLTNMSMDGLARWNLTQAEQEESDDPDVDVFKFVIEWPVVSFFVNWYYESQKPDVKNVVRGTLYIELDGLNSTIGWTSTKSDEDIGTLDEFTLDVATKTARLKITNLALFEYLIDIVGGPAVAYLVNNNPMADALTQVVKLKIIEDWIKKPERIDAINAKCSTK